MDDYRRNVRRLKRLEAKFARLGFPNPSCAVCGEMRIQLLELHHIAGAANSDQVVPLCVKCHRLVSDAQEDFGLDLRRRDESRSPLLKAAALNDGAAALFVPYAAHLQQWSAFFAALDQHLTDRFGPGWWRQFPKGPPR
jgi:hypothetical protein